MKREEWIDLARKVDWTLSYVDEQEAFPPAMSGSPWLPATEWQGWDEPYRTTYAEYVTTQHEKEVSLHAVREVLGGADDFKQLPMTWRDALKLHAATLPLAEFAAVIGNLRAARFGRDSAWRSTATLGALDELRHTQIPLSVMHGLVPLDGQFDWTHRFYHSENWVAIAARHMIDEMLLGANPIEMAIGTNFVFETGFTNLQFVALSSLAHDVGDRLFEAMLSSIQCDEARHAQIGGPVLAKVIAHDKAYAQYLVDKWFWRSWQLFAVVTGFAMDYLTPLAHRRHSFKEFVEEWVLDQFVRSLEDYGLGRPWYWDTFVSALDHYHHMVYASAYTYRASVWFNFVVPGPDERAWLREKYPASWDEIDPVWQQITDRWRSTERGNDFAVHGTSIVSFCDLCQLVLCGGTPGHNTAEVLERDGRKYVFCSAPCKWLFEREPERYAAHKGVVTRVLAGEMPANLIALLRRSFGLDHASWGKDAFQGDYPWLHRSGGAVVARDVVKPTLSSASSPPVMPLYGFVEGDSMGVVVLIRPDETARDLAQRLKDAVAVRVAPRGEASVMFRGEVLDPTATLRSEGIGPLDRVDLVWRRSPPGTAG
jgi:toluene monooxygenase system protein A